MQDPDFLRLCGADKVIFRADMIRKTTVQSHFHQTIFQLSKANVLSYGQCSFAHQSLCPRKTLYLETGRREIVAVLKRGSQKLS